MFGWRGAIYLELGLDDARKRMTENIEDHWIELGVGGWFTLRTAPSSSETKPPSES